MIGRTPELCPHGVLGKRKCKECLRREQRGLKEVKKKWMDANIETMRASRKRWREKCPEKVNAHSLGRSTQLGTECTKCGSLEQLERHHPDYQKPLEVVTLCRDCHTSLHTSLGE